VAVYIARKSAVLQQVLAIRLKQAAQVLLADRGVDLRDVAVLDGIDEPTTWVGALFAELDGRIVGMARLTELDPALLCLAVLGYTEMTGTTFRDVIFNGPLYKSLGCVEDPEPHPIMIERRKVECAVGLDRLGTRVVMRPTL
jgi:hypothetical protein